MRRVSKDELHIHYHVIILQVALAVDLAVAVGLRNSRLLHRQPRLPATLPISKPTVAIVNTALFVKILPMT